MTWIMILTAFGCFVLAFFCGYWALYKVDKAPTDKPHYEFVIKQLTMGAWTFGLLFVVMMIGATMVEGFQHREEPEEEQTDVY